jgi:hypothetical protein
MSEPAPLTFQESIRAVRDWRVCYHDLLASLRRSRRQRVPLKAGIGPVLHIFLIPLTYRPARSLVELRKIELLLG